MNVGHFIGIPPDHETDWGHGWKYSIEWCDQHVPSRDWHYAGLGQFAFVREQDAVMFALRWL